MKRGFKSDAERQALRIREDLQIQPHAPLLARRLAGHLGFQVARPQGVAAIPGSVAEWMSTGTCGWSACLLSGAGVQLILYNPSASVGRQESSLMHELAHVLCGHASKAIDFASGLSLRQYVKDDEDEASWLGGCLQIPRDALAHHVCNRKSPDEVAEHFSASIEMVRFRYQMTGLARQLNWRGW